MNIGNTPLLRFPWLERPGVEVYGKAEWVNPSGSVKDRSAWQIFREAIDSGALRPGMTLVDSSSGNAGISYAMIGQQLGYPVTVYMAASATEARKRMIREYGAEIVLTDPDAGSDGAYQAVQHAVAGHPDRYFYANQYANDATWRAHAGTTGPEIWERTEGAVTHVVAGIGTGGTLRGMMTFLRQQNPAIRATGVIPDGQKHALAGLRHLPTAMTPAIWDDGYADTLVAVTDADARAMLAKVSEQEGIALGPSAGAALVAAQRIAADATGCLVAILPDCGDRYEQEVRP